MTTQERTLLDLNAMVEDTLDSVQMLLTTAILRLVNTL